MSVKICEFDGREQIISLWREAFGDEVSEVEFFLENCRNKRCIAVLDGDELCSMLFFVDCKVNGENAEYIYAASTYIRRRGKGDMTALLEHCKNKCSVIALIPGSDDLVRFYEKRGFTNRADISNIEFDESDEIKEYLFEGSTLEKPFLQIYKEN